MDAVQFKNAIESVSDQLIDYNDNIHTRRVMSEVEPGYLKKLLPDLPPQDGEEWEGIQKDMEAKIMPGMTHWNSPNFMAYFPAPTSYPSMLGELYSSALAVSAFNWECSPAVTELEIVVMDWLVKMFELPPCYLSTSKGGGVMQGTTSEAVLALMVAARERYLNENTSHLSGYEKEEAVAQRRMRMVALGSEASHSCTQKAAMILGIRYRSVPVNINDDFSMTGAALAATLQQCHDEGLEPFYLTATLGTTATCAVDRFDEVARVLKGHSIWVHVDAAYAGAALVCDEYQHLTQYLGEFDSFSMSMSKWLLTNIDAVCCFIKNRHHLVNALSITPSYLRNDASDSGEVVDFRHWGVPLSRRFRALKVWFVIRTYGVNGLKSYIRNHIRLGELFASLIASRPDLFKIVTQPAYALTVVRILPRVPSVLRRFLTVKAEEASRSGTTEDHRAHQERSESETGGAISVNGSRRSGRAVSTNGKPTINGYGPGHGEAKTNGVTAANGHHTTNGVHFLSSEENSDDELVTNGHPHANGLSHEDGELKANGKPLTNGWHPEDGVETKRVWFTENELKVKKSHAATHLPITNGIHTNGLTKPKSAANGITHGNGHASIDEEPHIKEDPASTTSKTLASSTHKNPSHNASLMKPDEAAGEWLMEYGNMVTKEVYDLINRRGEIMLTSTVIGGLFVIRINGANPKTEEKYMRRAFEILVDTAEEVLDGGA